jgi:hypothetical protein
MRFILREATSNQPQQSSSDVADYFAEYQSAESRGLLKKKGFHSREWVSENTWLLTLQNMVMNNQQVSVFQEPADKS